MPIYKFYPLGVLMCFLHLAPSHLQGQCSGCAITVSASSATGYSINTGQRLCITGGTYTGTVSLNHANSKLCIGSGATFQGTLNQNSSGSEVTNHGTWNTGNLTVGGTFDNFGSMTTNNFTVNSSGDFYSSTDMVINGNFSTSNLFEVDGNVTVNGNFTVNSSASVNISGVAIITGNATNSNDMYIGDSLSIGGNFTNNSNADATIDGPVSIGGNVTNNNNLTLTGNSAFGGNFTNNSNGDLYISGGVLTVAGNFDNNGNAHGGFGSCGGVTVSGSSSNSGNFGTDGSLLDICDNGAGFDQNTGSIGASITNCQCSNGTILPIELIYFTAQRSENCVNLNWKTLTETANDHFVLMHSEDGKSFKNIVKVTGAGYSQQPIDYTFRHCASQAGGWYQLAQVDFDGDTRNYGPVYASLSEDADDKCIVHLSGDYMSISASREISHVEVKNQLGQQVYPVKLQWQEDHLQAYTFIPGWQGLMIIVVHFTNGQHEVFKLLK